MNNLDNKQMIRRIVRNVVTNIKKNVKSDENWGTRNMLKVKNEKSMFNIYAWDKCIGFDSFVVFNIPLHISKIIR